ncbi:MAG: cupin domain-containing protein [Chloroflexi bacterium]|jgi:oxalate decarboxylase/phosphoglucose isomerase-like protein (cupin superfamily)|nr:cupin domain-containing protein [Chloroflexota bacterium]
MTDPKTRFIGPDDVETQVFDWGTIKWQSEVRVTGQTSSTGGLVILDPGKGHARHNHPGSDEILYFISGEGLQMIEDDAGNPMERPMKPGDMAFIPEGIFHSTINTGWEPLRILAIYSPGGPEAILRGLPDCVIVPPGELPVR